MELTKFIGYDNMAEAESIRKLWANAKLHGIKLLYITAHGRADNIMFYTNERTGLHTKLKY